MLIKTKSKTSFYGERASERRKREEEGRYKTQKGMAIVALQAKRQGRPEVDARGVPLLYSNRMADGSGTKNLERWAKGRRTVYSIPK